MNERDEDIRRITESPEFKRRMNLIGELTRALEACVADGMSERELEGDITVYLGRLAGPDSVERAVELDALPYPAYLQSAEWVQHRELAKDRFGHRCAACNRDVPLEVHHRTYENKPFEQPTDLLPLCTACHTAVHLAIDARKGKTRPASRRASA